MASTARLARATRRFAKIEATTEGGDNTLVAGVTGRQIFVVGFAFTGTKAGLFKFKGGSTVIGPLEPAEKGGVSYAGGDAAPAFECAVGEPLKLETPASTKAYGFLTYVLI